MSGLLSQSLLLFVGVHCVFYIIISEVSVLTVTVEFGHAHVAVDPAACEYGHVRQGVHRDVHMPPMHACAYHVDIPRLHAEELCALPQSLYEVCGIIAHSPYRFGLLSLSIGQGQRPVVVIVEIGIHELAESVGPPPHVGSLYPLRSGIQLLPPHPLRSPCPP